MGLYLGWFKLSLRMADPLPAIIDCGMYGSILFGSVGADRCAI